MKGFIKFQNNRIYRDWLSSRITYRTSCGFELLRKCTSLIFNHQRFKSLRKFSTVGFWGNWIFPRNHKHWSRGDTVFNVQLKQYFLFINFISRNHIEKLLILAWLIQILLCLVEIKKARNMTFLHSWNCLCPHQFVKNEFYAD